MLRTIAITNQKGGVGKTTTAYELGYLFNKKGKTLVIDLDSQRDISRYADADPNLPTIGDVLRADIHPEDAIQQTNWFDIIPGAPDLAESAKEFSEEDFELLKYVIEMVQDNYQYVIIDNAPARSPLLYMAYIAADYVIPTTECDEGSVEATMEIAADLDRFFANNMTHAKILGILMTKYERTNMHALALENLEQIAKDIGSVVFKTKIRKAIAVSESKTAHMPINAYAKFNGAAKDYRSLYNEINKMMGEQ